MRAVVLKRPCMPEELTVTEVNIPTVKQGWVLIKVKAFGLNRSEMYTRQGHSPSVALPRIIGIECVGEVADPSDSKLAAGQKVLSIMGGLGREFDGSYAEYALIPETQVYPIDTELDWPLLASIPETYFTAYGSLMVSLQAKADETLLIRGGTSTVGLAACQIAKAIGMKVYSTTRSESKAAVIKQAGADVVLIDDGTLSSQLRKYESSGVHKVLELAGTGTLRDSLSIVKEQGIVCMTGVLNGWVLDDFEPMDNIPTGVYLTSFHSSIVNSENINELFCFLKDNHIEVPMPQTFLLEEISIAHRMMEDNKANKKMVVVV